MKVAEYINTNCPKCPHLKDSLSMFSCKLDNRIPCMGWTLDANKHLEKEDEKAKLESLRVVECIRVDGQFQDTMMVKLEDGSYHDAFSYYTDELSFSTHELIGLTLQECKDLFHRKDVAYLRS